MYLEPTWVDTNSGAASRVNIQYFTAQHLIMYKLDTVRNIKKNEAAFELHRSPIVSMHTSHSSTLDLENICHGPPAAQDPCGYVSSRIPFPMKQRSTLIDPS